MKKIEIEVYDAKEKQPEIGKNVRCLLNTGEHWNGTVDISEIYGVCVHRSSGAGCAFFDDGDIISWCELPDLNEVK